MDLIAIKAELKQIEEKLFTVVDATEFKALQLQRNELLYQLNSTSVKAECLKYLASIRFLDVSAQKREKAKVVDAQKQLLELPLTQEEFNQAFDNITLFPETLYLLFKNQSKWMI